MAAERMERLYGAPYLAVLRPAGSPRIQPRAASMSWPVLLALALIALSRMLWIGRPALLRDEAYYWDWSRRLDWGYFDHPPLIAMIIRATTTLAGVNEFGVRLGMAILAVGTAALAYRACALLGGRLAGWLSMLMLATCPLLTMMSSFAMPDGPLLFCWSATVYCMLLAITNDRGRYWLVAGIWLGLALLAKYMAIFLVPSTALFMIISGRRWMRRREPYLMMAIALLIFSPNLWWNMRHGWVTFVFQLHHGSSQAATADANAFQAAGLYMLAQMGCVGPLLMLLLGCGTAMALLNGLRRRQESQVLLACCTLVISGFFLLVHGLVYWAAPAYFTAIVCTSTWLASVLDSATPARRTMLAVYSALALLCGCAESAYSVQMLLGGGLVPASAAKIDPILVERQFPWPAVGRNLQAAMRALRPVQRRTVTLMADRYETAGEVAFYVPGHPNVYSGSHQYTLWGPPLAAPGAVIFVGNVYRLGDARMPIRRHERILADLSIRSGDHVRYLQIILLPSRSSREASAMVKVLMARTSVCACSFWRWS